MKQVIFGVERVDQCPAYDPLSPKCAACKVADIALKTTAALRFNNLSSEEAEDLAARLKSRAFPHSFVKIEDQAPGAVLDRLTQLPVESVKMRISRKQDIEDVMVPGPLAIQ